MTSETPVRITWIATAVFAVVQVAAVVAPDGPAGTFSVAFALVMFALGAAAFLWAFLIAAERSRDEPVTVAGVVWLLGSVPRRVAWSLRLALVVQVVVAVAAASIRPFSAVAFGVLMPMFGLGVIAWYGARHGVFDPTAPSPVPAAQAVPDGDAPGADDRAGSSADRRPITPDRADPDDFDQLFRRRKRR